MFSGIDCAMIATEMIQAAVKERYNITLDAKLGTKLAKNARFRQKLYFVIETIFASLDLNVNL